MGESADVNPYGGADPDARQHWCTPKWLANLIGPVDLDPCSNERSHIQARIKWQPPRDALAIRTFPTGWTIYCNPPYGRGEVERWVASFSRANFLFLLRFDPSTIWFARLMKHRPYVWFPRGRRIAFEPPPGVAASSNPFPHALFCKSEPNLALRSAGYVFRWA
jgi:hypothetical protein